jgi:predicted small secreted protein
MKTLSSFIAFALCALLLSGCHTAHRAVSGVADEGEHAVQKTSHAVEHGVRKVERHL